MAEGKRSRYEPVLKVRHSNATAKRESAAYVQGININNLPDEVMLNIFSYFYFNELIDIVQNVCTRWKRLAHDPVLWLDKEFIAGGLYEFRDCCLVECSKCVHCRCEETDEGVLQTAAMTPQLRKLTITRNIKDRVLREMCTNWPNLTELRIRCHQKMNAPLMKHIFKRCPKIKKLRVGGSLLTVQWCAELLSDLKHLRSVEVFDDNSKLRPVRLRALADGCPCLEEIYIDCNYYSLDVDDVEYFFRAKKHKLTFANVPWMVTDTMCMVPLLKQCNTSLRKLGLLSYNVPRELEAMAFKAVGELHGLHELFVSMVFPRRPRLLALAFQPGCLTQLRRLQLRNMSTVKTATAIAISRSCPNLRELTIDCSQEVTDTALTEIHRLKHLEMLDLSGCNRLGGTAMAYISQLPALHTLVLKYIHNMTKLQPSLQQIVNMKELRCLNILKSKHNVAVPFSEFPGRLVKLSELHVTYEDTSAPNYNMPKIFFAGLQRKMPYLRVYSTLSS